MSERRFILVGETSVNDAQIFSIAFTKLRDVAFHIALDGDEILTYLRGHGKYANRHAYPFPTWMLLNFQLPVRPALDVVQYVRHHPECNVVPIILFSDSPTASEVKKAYELGVNTVFKKPQSQAAMEEAIEVLGHYWGTAEVPAPPASHKCE